MKLIHRHSDERLFTLSSSSSSPAAILGRELSPRRTRLRSSGAKSRATLADDQCKSSLARANSDALISKPIDHPICTPNFHPIKRKLPTGAANLAILPSESQLARPLLRLDLLAWPRQSKFPTLEDDFGAALQKCYCHNDNLMIHVKLGQLAAFQFQQSN